MTDTTDIDPVTCPHPPAAQETGSGVPHMDGGRPATVVSCGRCGDVLAVS